MLRSSIVAFVPATMVTTVPPVHVLVGAVAAAWMKPMWVPGVFQSGRGPRSVTSLSSVTFSVMTPDTTMMSPSAAVFMACSTDR